MYEEVLCIDMYVCGNGLIVVLVIDGLFYQYSLMGIVGVVNIGIDCNWMGNFFGQVDWFVFG